MADQRIIFRNCVPDGDLSQRWAPGELVIRDWTLYANVPPELQEALDNGAFGPDALAVGGDGELYTLDGVFLAEVNTVEWRLTFNNITHRPPGNTHEWRIPDSTGCVLTFQEAVFRDAVLLQQIITSIADRAPGAPRRQRPLFNFQCVLKGVE